MTGVSKMGMSAFIKSSGGDTSAESMLLQNVIHVLLSDVTIDHSTILMECIFIHSYVS